MDPINRADLESLAYTWAEVRAEFPRFARQGIDHVFVPVEKFDRLGHPRHFEVDALTYRDESKLLRGVLYHYERDMYDAEGNLEQPAHELNVYVDPAFQRRGIATRLVDHAADIWAHHLNLSTMRLTPAGQSLAKRFENDPRRWR